MDIIKSYVMRLEGDDMNKLAYDSLHKFLVSIGTLLVITPFVAVYFIIQGDVQLISVEEYQALSDYSKHVIDSKEYLLRISKYAFIPFFVVIIALGITLFVWGIKGWKKNQIELDEQTRLSNDEVRKKLQDYDKEDKDLKRLEIEQESNSGDEIQDVKHSCASKKHKSGKSVYVCMSEQVPAFSEEKSCSNLSNEISYSNYEKVENAFFQYGIHKIIDSDRYIIEREKKIGGCYIDGIAISKNDYSDIIYEIKWWPNSFNINFLRLACQNLRISKNAYKKETGRNCEAQLVAITREDKAMSLEKKIKEALRDKLNETEIVLKIISVESLKKD